MVLKRRILRTSYNKREKYRGENYIGNGISIVGWCPFCRSHKLYCERSDKTACHKCKHKF